MNFNVSNEHINNGSRSDCNFCPLAIAISDFFEKKNGYKRKLDDLGFVFNDIHVDYTEIHITFKDKHRLDKIDPNGLPLTSAFIQTVGVGTKLKKWIINFDELKEDPKTGDMVYNDFHTESKPIKVGIKNLFDDEKSNRQIEIL